MKSKKEGRTSKKEGRKSKKEGRKEGSRPAAAAAAAGCVGVD